MKNLIFSVGLCFLFTYCQGGKMLKKESEPAKNFLTAEEQAAGWKLLFDGKTFNGWRGFRKDKVPKGWEITKLGELHFKGKGGGDIMTVEEFDDFELRLEWKISPRGNSGIFFRVSEKRQFSWQTGPEMQVLDNTGHKDGRNPLTSAGSNYALHAPTKDVTREVGLYNEVKIVVERNHVEHWLNGVKIVEYEIGDSQWQMLVANSKFGKLPDYGRYRSGHIVLQDHGDKVWYRHIKIRPL
ncbi:MAG: DUF1080 domain-containing protein [bacterium]